MAGALVKVTVGMPPDTVPVAIAVVIVGGGLGTAPTGQGSDGDGSGRTMKSASGVWTPGEKAELRLLEPTAVELLSRQLLYACLLMLLLRLLLPAMLAATARGGGRHAPAFSQL